MKKKKLALNLSKTSIQLLLSKEDNRWQVIGSANPGSDNINKEILVLKNQASALCGKKPEVDILLPKELILSQTIIVEDNISVDECKKIIAERCGLNAHELYVATGKSSTRRTLPVAAITVKSIGETRNFVKNKGFIPNRFIAADKISGFKYPPVFIKDKTKWQGIDFDSTTTLKVISIFSMFLFLGFLFSLGSTILEYREKSKPHSFLPKIYQLTKFDRNISPYEYRDIKNIIKTLQEFQSAQIPINLTPKMIEPEVPIKTNNFEVSSNKYKISERQKNSRKMIRDFSTKRFFNVLKEPTLATITSTTLIRGKTSIVYESEKLIRELSFANLGKSHNHPFVESEIAALPLEASKKELQLESVEEVIGLKRVKNILESFTMTPYTKITHKDYQKIVIEEVFADISLSKISIKSDMSRASVLPAIFSFSAEPIIFKTNIDSNKYKEIGNSFIPNIKLDKTEYQNQQGLKTIALIDRDFEISKHLHNKLKRKDEILSELSTTFFLRPPLKLILQPSKNFNIVENWSNNFPHSKPSIIDLIRVVDDPTKSSGAITYVELPPKMPATVIALKKVNANSIKNLSVKSKPPSIPKRSSIVGNSTLKNIIELNRTNLIGVFGKRNGRIALIRLSSGGMVRVGVGQKFGEGWRVLSIDIDKIHISNGKRQETLRIPG